MKMLTIESALDLIENDPDYRIIRRFKVPEEPYNLAEPGAEVRCGVYLDCETDGVDTARSEIIELAMVPFTFTPGGKLLEVDLTGAVSMLNEPTKGLSDEIRKLTGIEPVDLLGQRLDFDVITSYCEDADLVVAHNAGFDRKFVERYHAGFETVPWACSQQDVPWREAFHAPGERLEVLAMFKSHVFYGAHRAMIDCMIGIHVLATTLDENGRGAFEYLYESSTRESVRIWATGAPFETKEMLSKRGYRWNDGKDGRFKAWNKQVTPEQLDTENEWLRTQCGAYPNVTTCEALDRYSVREK